MTILNAAAAFLLALQSDPPYIFGLHEPGGESNMSDMGKKGWILFTEEVGRDPLNTSGKDFRPWSNLGYGVIVRINHGYGPSNGTVPYDHHYDAFAQRVANYVAASPGAHLWIIGNETNHPQEWPRYEGWEQPVTAALYASCFTKCRSRIKALAGHASDQVILQPTAPWAAVIGEGWVEYHVDVLNRIGSGNLDGIALHTYTHGSDPNLIWSEAMMAPPYNNRHYNFRAYKDFMNAHPTWARTLPVYITETAQNGPWADTNSGWVRNAYGEINSWNMTSGTQKIRSLILYRWPALDASYIVGKQGVIDDFRDAMRNDYRWTTWAIPDVIVTSLSYANGGFTSTVKNQGSSATPSGVAVGVAYWVDGTYRTWGSVMGPLAVGASVTIGTNGGSNAIPDGTHTLMAWVDDVNRFSESNENNNKLSQQVTLGTSPTALPDVVVTSLSYSGGVFSCTVLNQGNAATPSGVSVGVGYFVDGAYRTWGALMGPLAAGTSVTIGTNGGSYFIPSGTHTITAVVDDVNRFTESNEANNSLSISRAVTVMDVISSASDSSPESSGGGGGTCGALGAESLLLFALARRRRGIRAAGSSCTRR